jgi:hypothetical protein
MFWQFVGSTVALGGLTFLVLILKEQITISDREIDIIAEHIDTHLLERRYEYIEPNKEVKSTLTTPNESLNEVLINMCSDYYVYNLNDKFKGNHLETDESVYRSDYCNYDKINQDS